MEGKGGGGGNAGAGGGYAGGGGGDAHGEGRGRRRGRWGGGKGGRGGGGGGGRGGGAPAPDAWDAAQLAGLGAERPPLDLERARPQKVVEAFPQLTVAADWPEGKVPRSGSAFYLPLIWTALLLEDEAPAPAGGAAASSGGGGGCAAARRQLEAMGDAKHFHGGAVRRASMEDVRAAQAFWRQVFSAWDDWASRLRAAMRGSPGGLDGVVERWVRKTSVTACALIYGDLQALGALPHISNARNSPDQDAILELDFMLRVELEAGVAALFAPGPRPPPPARSAAAAEPPPAPASDGPPAAEGSEGQAAPDLAS